MPLTNVLPWVFVAVVASIAAMVTGVLSDLPAFSCLAAGLFAMALVATAVDLNLPWWNASEPDAAMPIAAAIGNARLLVIGYFWGALSLFAIYRLTPLRWQHGLQYGFAMALIAWFALLYCHLVARPDSKLGTPRGLMQAAWLSLAHGGAALAGVLFVLLSGKVHSVKDDWPANQIFLAGGLTVVALSLIAVYTQLKLARARLEMRKAVQAEPG